MKKKIVALFATIAAVLGFGFATGTAMAVENYSTTGTISGNTVTASAPAGTFAANESVDVTYDTTYVSDVVAIAVKTVNAKADGSLTLKYILTDAGLEKADNGGFTISAVGKTSGSSFSATVKTGDNTPATGAPSNGASNNATGTKTTANTGASVAPYGVAIVLMAAAGVALFAVRKKATR
ncbi:hypothetical protein [Bifidobacterium eulemuris]|uniref:Uncharacterized protein n=1 Tax=Bifidobacterium eulemuris TaxID=1765219 RepID=A0A261GAX2_9BIFI|nr:hypothetical protein [Bifidobacterium eulemuris]OZG68569.1 hypothetical protein BEUL_0879 [Bifidobacterium eulemuris]QOL32698.1 hypothetical protein BE0216_09805 [Bifidobacterium eulemuris]